MKNYKVLYFFALIVLNSACTTNQGSESAQDTTYEAAFNSSFDFQPEAPKNGKLLGIMELSFSGFNSFVIEIDDNDNWSMKKAVYGQSFVDEKGITLEQVMSRIETFKSDMVELGLNENSINLVVSSSAFKNEKVQEIARQLRSNNIGLISINPEQEAIYAFLATVPEHLSSKAFLIDIGSGSSKLSWMENNKIVAIETYGSKYQLNDISDLDVYHALKDALSQIPDENKSICFMVGGTAFNLAKATDARAGRYTILKHPDEYSKLKEQQEIAGLNIYNAIYSDATYNYVFDWEANFTVGILMNVN